MPNGISRISRNIYVVVSTATSTRYWTLMFDILCIYIFFKEGRGGWALGCGLAWWWWCFLSYLFVSDFHPRGGSRLLSPALNLYSLSLSLSLSLSTRAARRQRQRAPWPSAQRGLEGLLSYVVARLVSSVGTSREGAPAARAAHDSPRKTQTAGSSVIGRAGNAGMPRCKMPRSGTWN